jgi:hypothetical protein
MSDEKKAAPQPDLNKFRIVEPQQGTVRTYANLYYLAWTGSDITVHLYHLEQPNREFPTHKDEPSIMFHNAAVTLTWASAKTFHQALGHVLERHEKVYGPINTEFKQI